MSVISCTSFNTKLSLYYYIGGLILSFLTIIMQGDEIVVCVLSCWDPSTKLSVYYYAGVDTSKILN